jgi:hypothetical protein
VKVSRGDRAKLEEAIASTGYAFEDMTSNAAYNMLYGCQRVGACAISFDEDEA